MSMAGTINYDRDKNPKINDTGIAVVPLVGEEPTAAGAMSGDNSGSTGILNIEFQGDADESGGAALVNLARIDDLQVTVDVDTGRINITGTVIPILGDGTDAPTTTPINVVHPQTMDAWQTAAGRVQQV